MKKYALPLRDLLNELLLFAFLLSFAGPAACGLWQLSSGHLRIWWLLALLPLCWLGAWLRRVCKRVLTFFIAHLAIFLLPLALPLSALEKLGWFFALLLLVGCSVHAKYRPPAYPRPLMWAGVALHGAGWLLTLRFSLPELAALQLLCVCILLVVTPILRYLTTVEDSLDTLYGNRLPPNRRLLKRNGVRLALGHVALLVVVLGGALVMQTDWFMRLLLWLRARLYDLLRWLGSLFPVSEVTLEDVPMPEAMPSPDGMMDGPPPGDAPAWLEWLYTALTWLMLAAVVFFVLWLAVKAVRWLLANFSQQSESSLPQSAEEDKVERVAFALKHRRRDFGGGQARRIRRQYFQLVTRRAKAVPAAAATTGEILRDNTALTSLAELTPLYEAVRYGMEE